MRVLKFGGSSIKDAKRIRAVEEIVTSYELPLVVVVSAIKGTTDTLINMGTIASTGSVGYLEEIENLQDIHEKVAKELVEEKALEELLKEIRSLFLELSDTLHGVSLVKELSDRTLDLIMSYGERLSAFILTSFLKQRISPVICVDGRDIIVTSSTFGNAVVDYETTNKKIKEAFKGPFQMAVVTGFIAATLLEETTTLGRGGSDYTAAIIGAALDAEAIEIWSDVDGVMTADPRKVSHAFAIAEMSYQELMEMSHFGAKVIHPPTIAPAMHQGIPLLIKNSYHPKASGTQVVPSVPFSRRELVRGISSIDHVSLLRLEGSGMIGVCGVASRLFAVLASHQISIMMISQASSEHSICFAVLPDQAIEAKRVVDKEFSLEYQAGLIDRIAVTDHVSVIAVVGENMHEMPGVSGRFFSALGCNGINIVAIAQGSSERNITCIVESLDEEKALNVIHDEFFLSKVATIHLFLVGVGLIGSALIQQIQEQVHHLHKDLSLEIKLCGLANSQKMILQKDGIAITKWQEVLESSTEKMEIGEFIRRMSGANLSNSIFVDCTASREVADSYLPIIEESISVVTPNKRANSGSYEYYRTLKRRARQRGVEFSYETNVGAGLPVVSTLEDLLLSGDKIEKVEAILSGTLSYIFNNFSGSISFDEIVKQAESLGYTEPDPREDLGGIDVARKILILARECGYPLEMEEVTVEPLLPGVCFSVKSIEEFYKELKKASLGLNQRRDQAANNRKVLRYVASLEKGKALVKLIEVDSTHPFYTLSGSDNIVAIYSKRYSTNPLVVKGAGAGADVTAGGVFADIIKIGKR